MTQSYQHGRFDVEYNKERAWRQEITAVGEGNNTRGTGYVQGEATVMTELWENSSYQGRWGEGGNRTGIIWKLDFIVSAVHETICFTT